MYRTWGKRLIDILGAALLMAFLWPLFLAVALLLKLEDPSGSIIFTTKRLAQGGGEYKLLKFRTMVTDAERRLRELLERDPQLREEYYRTYKLRNDPRVTPVGRFLRRWSLDELPQFFNVLRGDMSLVGPRQILASELWKYGEHASQLVTVRPGITGLWQVSGRSRLPYEERVRLDMKYIDSLSLWLDFKILLKTPAAVIRGEGAI